MLWASATPWLSTICPRSAGSTSVRLRASKAWAATAEASSPWIRTSWTAKSEKIIVEMTRMPRTRRRELICSGRCRRRGRGGLCLAGGLALRAAPGVARGVRTRWLRGRFGGVISPRVWSRGRALGGALVRRRTASGRRRIDADRGGRLDDNAKAAQLLSRGRHAEDVARAQVEERRAGRRHHARAARLLGQRRGRAHGSDALLQCCLCIGELTGGPLQLVHAEGSLGHGHVEQEQPEQTREKQAGADDEHAAVARRRSRHDGQDGPGCLPAPGPGGWIAEGRGGQ